MSTLEPGWLALAEAVKSRRARLGINQEDVPTRGGPSSSTVRKIEAAAADRYQARILFQLDEALAWGKGTSQEIVEGPRSWMGSFEEFVEEVIRDTQNAERRGDDYPVGWPTKPRERTNHLSYLLTDGQPVTVEIKRSSRLANVSDEELVAELAARLRRGNAQEQEPQQSTRGPAGSSSGGGGTPIGSGGGELEIPVRDPIPDHLSGESTRSAQ